MGLTLVDLGTATRRHMAAEVEGDITGDRLVYSERFSLGGKARYPDLLRSAVADHDDEWLAQTLAAPGTFLSHKSVVRRGRLTSAKVPVTAPWTFAEGEFNRFYLRGLCLRAIEEGKAIEVYRAKAVASPRPESTALIGTRFDPRTLLTDLRTHLAVETALGLPAGPNSGLSGRIVP